MIKVSNIQHHKDLPFDEYLRLPGYSFSSIKSDGKKVQETENMRLGTAVHSYLLAPAEYKYENLALVRPLALTLMEYIGGLYKHLIPELGVTANFSYNGFCLPYKGRLDLCYPGRLVIDIKVTKMDIQKAIEYFLYDEQQSGYSLAIEARTAIIISINPLTLKTKTVHVELKEGWWREQIMKKGEPIL